MRRGAIILCGGRSRRMGLAKATLPFGPELMLQRVVRRMGEVVAMRVVVAAADQPLPALPPGVRIARDAHEDRGPLEGLAAGLRALAGDAELVYVTGCDVPELAPAFIERMFALCAEHEIAVPTEGEFYHPLAAVYRASLLSRVESLLREDRLRARELFELSDTNKVSVESLRAVDPQLATLENLNHPADYLAALQRAGFEAPAEIIAALQREAD